jgi:hypothetical protein
MNQEMNQEKQISIMKNEKGSALPYIFGWILGVPTSILFLVFLFRNV